MWTRMLEGLLDALVQQDRLTVIWPNGRRSSFGTGTARPVTLRLHDPGLPRRLVLNPELALGDGYMQGTLSIGDDDLHGLLALLLRNRAAGHGGWVISANLALRRLTRALAQHNPMGRSRQNVAHHYDLSGELYDLFLDEDRQYSCAYFRDPHMSLDAAQQAKKHHIAAKLRLEPGMQVLDIGCGWGGLALTLARDYGVRVTGVTLSQEQFDVATRRARDAGLSDRVTVLLRDYRRMRGPFDRVVSVGMFEHVGVPHYAEYFDRVRDLMAPDGIALIHTIGRRTPPGTTSPWITRHIFPGGYVPALSETMAHVERTGMWTCDVEVLRLHYAETLRHWYDRFMANLPRAQALYDDQFCRMWRYYLVASEQSFRHHNQVVFQLQLSRDQAAVPLTRDYLYPPNAQQTAQFAAE